MNQHLTIAYLTSRKDPKIEWFFDSMGNQTDAVDGITISVIVVDFHYDERPGHFEASNIKHVACKPSVWQGKHRLTSVDYFAASNARNTALCHAQDGWIAYVDDLSVLMPGWMNAVREAMNGHKVVFGAYKKVKKLKVENGIAVSYEEFPGGVDSRWNSGRDGAPVVASGSWMFGCSLVAPVEAFLTVGGWPEALCDSVGGEDYVAGIMMQNSGYEFLYDRRMFTLESEEHHHEGTPMKRIDKGVSPRDKSHAILNTAMGGLRTHPNYFGEEGIRGLRQRILKGEQFPIAQVPEHDWWDAQPLREM